MAKRKAKRRKKKNAWKGQRRRHATAAKKGWSKRKRARRNDWPGQPRRHAKAARKGWSKRRRSKRKTRRNPVLGRAMSHNQGRRRNPVLGMRMSHNQAQPIAQAMASIQASFQEAFSVDFWARDVVPTAVGFAGTGMTSQALRTWLPPQITELGLIQTGFNFGTHLINIGSAAIVTALAAMLPQVKRETSIRILSGGLLYTAFNLLRDTAPVFSKQIGLGDGYFDENDRNEIAGGMSDFLTAQELAAAPQLSDFATAQALAPGPQTGTVVLDDVMNEQADAYMI